PVVRRSPRRPVLQDPHELVRTAEDDVDDRTQVLLEAPSVRHRPVAERVAFTGRGMVVRRPYVTVAVARVIAYARRALVLHPRQAEPVDDDRVAAPPALEAEDELHFRDVAVEVAPP